MSWRIRVVVGLCVLGMSAVSASVLAADGGAADAGDAGDGGSCEAGSGLACEVCDVSGYTPETMNPPIGPDAGACTDNDISGFVTNCADPSTSSQTACTTWESTATPGCSACIYTQSTASQWGPVVCAPMATTCSYNIGGCLDIQLGEVSEELGSGGTGSCGDLLTADYGCQQYACGTCNTMTTDFTNCATSAVSNECASYANPIQSLTGPCSAIDGSATETSCFLQAGDSDINALITLMCGGYVPPPPPDGGTDAGTTVDAGGPKDAGTSKDAGTKDSGSSGVDAGGPDAGSSFNSSGGCHCDAAEAGGAQSTLVLLGLGGLVIVGFGRRRRRW